MEESETFAKAKRYHYDYHSHFHPIDVCAIQDCKKAVERELRRVKDKANA